MRLPTDLFDPRQLLTDPVELLTYETDAGMERALPDAIFYPESVGDVARLVAWAGRHDVPLVARGAGTGLAGGAVASRGGIVVVMTRMRRIKDIDTVGRTTVVEAGAVNLEVERTVRDAGLYYPPDPASGRSSLIGGNLGTNAGGPHCFKYGVTTNYVLGIEAVLADGSTVALGGRALDYPEYDLTALVVGSEGTLAVVTSAVLRLLASPPGVRTLMVSFESLEAAGEAVSAVIAAGLVPATLEAIDQAGMKVIEGYCQAGLPLAAGAALIVEMDGYRESLDVQTERVTDLLREYGADDLRIAQTEEERERIWYGRKSAAGAMSRLAPNYYLSDITVRRSRLAAVLAKIRELYSGYKLDTASFFHAGDGNLHPLILCDAGDEEQMQRVHRAIDETIDLCVEENGAISGEHGIGIEKRDHMAKMYGADELEAMRDVKLAFDPKNLLNPGKVLPEEVPAIGRQPARRPESPLFAPRSVDEAASGLAAFSEAGATVRIGGRPEQSESRDSVWLTTTGLSGIREFAPQDLYITVGAGTLVDEVESHLEAHGLVATIMSPWPDATVGSVIVANLNGPQRLRYGSLRDSLLAATVVLADGRILRAGRPLVKNVAGYDLPKVFVGSHGTLGLVVDATLKLSTAPRCRRTLAMSVPDVPSGVGLARAVIPRALVASAVVVAPPGLVPELENDAHALVYTAEGLEEDVGAELELVRHAWCDAGGARPVEVERSGSQIWSRFLVGSRGTRLVVRAGVPARDLMDFSSLAASEPHRPFLIDCAAGLCYGALETEDPEEAARWLESLRGPALALGGYAVAIEVPPSISDSIDRWGYRPQGLEVMRRLKARWDPAGILAPKTFIVG